MSDIVNLKKYKNKNWEIYEYYWGSAIKNSKTKQWTNVFLPDGTEINLEKNPALVHENGIEFLGR